jgi:hypothetical protein
MVRQGTAVAKNDRELVPLALVSTAPRLEPATNELLRTMEERVSDRATLDMTRVWNEAIPYADFVSDAQKNRSLWEGVYRISKIPDWALEAACETAKGVRLLAIVEDWCGDASNTVPVLAKLGELADCLEMRLVKRDENLDVMDHYLTNGSRSIPIVIVLSEQLEELGHWGPRPRELQQWVMDNKNTMPSEERYKWVRRWYAKDKGESTLREVLELVR